MTRGQLLHCLDSTFIIWLQSLVRIYGGLFLQSCWSFSFGTFPLFGQFLGSYFTPPFDYSFLFLFYQFFFLCLLQQLALEFNCFCFLISSIWRLFSNSVAIAKPSCCKLILRRIDHLVRVRERQNGPSPFALHLNCKSFIQIMVGLCIYPIWASIYKHRVPIYKSKCTF